MKQILTRERALYFICRQFGDHLSECSVCNIAAKSYCEEGLGLRKALGRINQE